MVAIDFFLKRKWKNPKNLLLEKMPWWILSLTFGCINIYFLGLNDSLNSSNAVVSHSFIDKLAIGAYSYAIYIMKWIFPYKMSPLYPYAPEVPLAAYVWLVAVPIALAGFLFWAFRKQKTTLITDAGHTVVAPGTRTCLGIGPADDATLDRLFGDLKLL